MIDHCSVLACYAFSDLWLILLPLSALYFKYYLFYYSRGNYNRILKDISSSRFLKIFSLFFYFFHSIFQDVFIIKDYS